MSFLRILLLVSALWCFAALLRLFIKTRAYGTRRLFAPEAGRPMLGACYAFTLGLAPWAKESVRHNLVSYFGGITFHLGIFTAFLLLVFYFSALVPPAWLNSLLGFAALTGCLAGLGLLLKRLLKKELRALSVPDDYLANLLSSLFCGLAFLANSLPALTPAWLISAILLLIYVPLGKTRHCLYFFTSRYHFGSFYGRRGTFPPGPGRA